MNSDKEIQTFFRILNVTAAPADLVDVKRLWKRYCLNNHPDKLGYESQEFHLMTDLYRSNIQDVSTAEW